MPLRDRYGYLTVLDAVQVVHDAEDAYSNVVTIHPYTTLLLLYDVTIAFSGGDSPGVKFTLEFDVSGEGDWVAATSLVTTENGFGAAAPTDPTITSTGKAYRFYPQAAGMRARIKYEAAGEPTGGNATVTAYLTGKRG